MLSSRSAVIRRLVLNSSHSRRRIPGRFVSDPVSVATAGSRGRLFSRQQQGAGSHRSVTTISSQTVSALSSSDANDKAIQDGHTEASTTSNATHLYSFEGSKLVKDATSTVSPPTTNSSAPNHTSRGLFVSGEPPLWELNYHYQTQHAVAKVSKLILGDRNTSFSRPWTASFTCPVTGALYPAGVLVSRRVHARRRPNGLISYAKKTTAVRAAAARALDVIQFQKLGITEPRFCEEDPSLWSMENQTVVAATKAGSTGVTAESESLALEGVVDLDATATAVEMAHEAEALDSGEPEVMQKPEQEYVIWDIPQNNGRPPYERIVEALSNATVGQPDSATAGVSTMPIPMSPQQQLHLAVDNVYAWLKQVDGLKPLKSSPHRLVLPRQEASSTLRMGKILLTAMGDANQSTVDISHGTENVAKKVLDVLWETNDSKPDTETYTAFLRCMQPNANPKATMNPKVVAAKAERIFFHMKTGTPMNGRVMPKPNTGTANALIQLWAQVGGTSGRYDNLDEDFKPNRESFLSVLSSAAYAPTSQGDTGGFDFDFSRQCVQRMQELADDDLENESLRPDTQIWNAPLRWSGGLKWRESRPYARFIPWDDYGKIFKDGFRTADDDDALTEEARCMETWLQEMTKSDVAPPDIETYEAIIQAWVRTGTRSGLEHAGMLADKLLLEASDCTIRPRLQTFHPILAAWINCKDREGAVKVQEWVGKLESAAALIPEVQPDGRVFGAQIAAHATNQLVVLDELDNTKISTCDDKTRDDLLMAAKACSEILEKQREHLVDVVETGKELDRILEVTSFADTIFAWSNVAHANQELDQESFDHATGEMVKVTESFESLVTTLSRAEDHAHETNPNASSGGVGLQTDRELSLQLRHMIVNAHRVYSSFVAGLRRLKDPQASTVDSSDNDQHHHLFVGHTYFIERMLRRVGEFCEIEAIDSSLKMRWSEKTYLWQGASPHDRNAFRVGGHRPITYEDTFRYQPQGELRLPLPSRDGFLMEVAGFLKESPLKEVPAGDLMRLALLIKDVERQGSEWSSSRTELETSVASLVDFVLQESIQLRRVRSPQQGSLSKFVQESIQLDRTRSSADGDEDTGAQQFTSRVSRQIRRPRSGGTRRRPKSSRKRRVSA